jgi:hypothetical protein
MCLIMTCIFVRGRGKIVLSWRLLIRFISLKTKHYLHCVQPGTQDGHIQLSIIINMNIYFHNFITMTFNLVLCKCSYISPSYFTPLRHSFLSSHWLSNKVQCTFTWFMVWFQMSYKYHDFPAPSFDV